MTHGRGEGGLTPFILLSAHFSSRPHPSSLRGVRLNFRGCAAKVLYAAQLPRRSSSWVGAVRRDERGRRRTGQVGAHSISFIQTINYVFGLETKGKWKGRSPSHPPLLVFFEWEAWGKSKSNIKLEFGTSTNYYFWIGNFGVRSVPVTGVIIENWTKRGTWRWRSPRIQEIFPRRRDGRNFGHAFLVWNTTLDRSHTIIFHRDLNSIVTLFFTLKSLCSVRRQTAGSSSWGSGFSPVLDSVPLFCLLMICTDSGLFWCWTVQPVDHTQLRVCLAVFSNTQSDNVLFVWHNDQGTTSHTSQWSMGTT